MIATLSENEIGSVTIVNPGAYYRSNPPILEFVGGFGYSIYLEAEAQDIGDGKIQRVEFFVNGTPSGSDSRFYGTSFRPSYPGIYHIVAEATDDDGNQISSSVLELEIGTSKDQLLM